MTQTIQKPRHFKMPGSSVPICDGTGRTRRFLSTPNSAEVTCERCRRSLERQLAPMNKFIEGLAR